MGAFQAVLTNSIDKAVVAVDNCLEVYTLQEVTIKEFRQVVTDAVAREFQHSLFHGPQLGERYAGICSGGDSGHLVVIKADMTQVDVSVLSISSMSQPIGMSSMTHMMPRWQ